MKTFGVLGTGLALAVMLLLLNLKPTGRVALGVAIGAGLAWVGAMRRRRSS